MIAYPEKTKTWWKKKESTNRYLLFMKKYDILAEVRTIPIIGREIMAGKRYSKQRELIYNAVVGSTEHPTAEMVYQWLKPANPNLSLGTVYRNLTLLAQEGLLIRMPFPVERYDGNVKPHSHFRCKNCSKVFDLKWGHDPEMDRTAEKLLPGFQIEGHDLTFSGICPTCQKEKETP